MDEVSYAQEENKRTVPVLYRSCRVPLQLRRLQYVDFTSDYAAGLSELSRVLSTLATPAQPIMRHAKEKSRYPLLGARPRLRGAIVVGLAGAAYGAISELVLYAHDARLGSTAMPPLSVTAAYGAIAAGALWTVASAIAKTKRTPLLWALATSVGMIVVWVAVGGTYVDVLSAAFIFGSPIGGIVGALGGRFISKG